MNAFSVRSSLSAPAFGAPARDNGAMSDARDGTGATPEIVMYGTPWCGDCALAKSVLEAEGIAYAYVDIDADSAAADTVIALNGGNRSVPTILWPDGTVLVEPSRRQLLDAIARL